MLENAKRQLILVAAVTAVAAFLIGKFPFKLGFDLKGGTQLIYELPIAEAKANGTLDKDADPERVIEETLSILAERIDPSGTRDLNIVRRGETGILIELPDTTPQEAAAIRRSIETLGRLEFRVLAEESYSAEIVDEDGRDTGERVKFDLPEEKKRLEAWLDEDDHRESLAEDPTRISLFNAIPASDEDDAKGRVSPYIKWFPRKIGSSPRDDTKWDSPETRNQFITQVYRQSEIDGDYPGDGAFLVSLHPINMHERKFAGEDMNPARVRSGTGDDGLPAVFYAMSDAVADAYATISENYKGKLSAVILNGIVRSTPSYNGRIYGTGMISGGFTEAEAKDLAKVLKTGSLQVKPQPVSSSTIGASLGQDSISRGLWSILIGGVLVLLFILAYYRVSGLVAFVAIALNVFLILGVMQFLQATFTLPGIAGLVLTVGMAVDANILIYERIREEYKRGKELLQAVRLGFERAMVTIIDANVTTFLTGLVLFNVGVGPVRGFAVTLMVGILTSLFTAFFVSRLIFHYLLESKKLTEFKTASWLSLSAYDFIGKRKLAFVLSAIVILIGIGGFASVPKEHVFGLDFTGGANLNVVLKEPMTRAEMAEALKADEAFAKDFPDPEISTIGDVEAGKTNQFSLKLKLTDALRARVEADKKKFLAGAEGQTQAWEPPYQRQVREMLSTRLVEPAFSNIKPEKLSETEVIGVMDVHFTTPVNAETIKTALATISSSVEVQPDDGVADAKDARNLHIEFAADPTWTETDYIERVQGALLPKKNADGEFEGGIRDTAGAYVSLSNPIPQSEQIGGRMVGELRNAAIGAILLSLILIVFYIRIRFHEYKYGFAAVAALLHDVLVAFGIVTLANYFGLVNAEIDLAMIAAFLTIIGYSINDTIVIFDRIRENLADDERLGTKEPLSALLNRSVNQTLSRTILTSGTTLFVVLAQFVVNYGQGTALEGFSFALIVGIISGTYSTMFVATPLVYWLRTREDEAVGASATTANTSAA